MAAALCISRCPGPRQGVWRHRCGKPASVGEYDIVIPPPPSPGRSGKTWLTQSGYRIPKNAAKAPTSAEYEVLCRQGESG